MGSSPGAGGGGREPLDLLDPELSPSRLLTPPRSPCAGSDGGGSVGDAAAEADAALGTAVETPQTGPRGSPMRTSEVNALYSDEAAGSSGDEARCVAIRPARATRPNLAPDVWLRRALADGAVFCAPGARPSHSVRSVRFHGIGTGGGPLFAECVGDAGDRDAPASNLGDRQCAASLAGEEAGHEGSGPAAELAELRAEVGNARTAMMSALSTLCAAAAGRREFVGAELPDGADEAALDDLSQAVLAAARAGMAAASLEASDAAQGAEAAEAQRVELEAKLALVEDELASFHEGQGAITDAVAALEAKHEARYREAAEARDEAQRLRAECEAALASTREEVATLRRELDVARRARAQGDHARQEADVAHQRARAELRRELAGEIDAQTARTEALREELAGEAAAEHEEAQSARAEAARAAAVAEEQSAMRERAEARAAQAEAASADAERREMEATACERELRLELLSAQSEAATQRRAAAEALSERDAAVADRERLEAELQTWRRGEIGGSGVGGSAAGEDACTTPTKTANADGDNLEEENAVLSEMNSIALTDNAKLKRRLAERRDECDALASRVAALQAQVESLSAVKPAAITGAPVAEASSPVRAGRDFEARLDEAAGDASGSATAVAAVAHPSSSALRQLHGRDERAAEMVLQSSPGKSGGGPLIGALRGHRARIRRLEKENEALRSTLCSPILKAASTHQSAGVGSGNPPPVSPLGTLSPALGLGLQHASLRNPYRH